MRSSGSSDVTENELSQSEDPFATALSTVHNRTDVDGIPTISLHPNNLELGQKQTSGRRGVNNSRLSLPNIAKVMPFQ